MTTVEEKKSSQAKGISLLWPGQDVNHVICWICKQTAESSLGIVIGWAQLARVDGRPKQGRGGFHQWSGGRRIGAFFSHWILYPLLTNPLHNRRETASCPFPLSFSTVGADRQTDIRWWGSGRSRVSQGENLGFPRSCLYLPFHQPWTRVWLVISIQSADIFQDHLGTF